MKKVIFTLLAAFCVQAQAYTLDFIGYNGSSIVAPATLNIPVPGYGTVVLSTLPGQTLSINNTFGAVAVNMDPTETLVVTFVGDPITGGSFDMIGLNLDSSDGLVVTPISSNTYQFVMGASGDGAGLRSISWEAVPEPSTTLFGAFSVLALAARRRRA
jgi:hypothetical protein